MKLKRELSYSDILLSTDCWFRPAATSFHCRPWHFTKLLRIVAGRNSDSVDSIAIIEYTCSYFKEGVTMASITIRNLDDDIKHRLRVRAAEHGRSMEEEARDILRRVMGDVAPPRNLAASIRGRVASSGGAEIELPVREPMREPPSFSKR
jgi:plasmid stability protein